MSRPRRKLGDVACEVAIYLGFMIVLLTAVGVVCSILGVKFTP